MQNKLVTADHRPSLIGYKERHKPSGFYNLLDLEMRRKKEKKRKINLHPRTEIKFSQNRPMYKFIPTLKA